MTQWYSSKKKVRNLVAADDDVNNVNDDDGVNYDDDDDDDNDCYVDAGNDDYDECLIHFSSTKLLVIYFCHFCTDVSSYGCSIGQIVYFYKKERLSVNELNFSLL